MTSALTVLNSELVARVIFPPQMILDGKVMPAAFVLRPSINEEYLSVLRIAGPTFNQDMKKLLYGRKRSFYGFAVLKVSEIHSIELIEANNSLNCKVLAVDNEYFHSHAGIFIFLNNERITGQMSFERLAQGGVQSHLLLAIRYRLTEMANNALVAF